MGDTVDEVLREQVAYYSARAPEYDQWMLRQGRYDRGEDLNARWFAAWTQVREAIARIPGDRILEIGCGTGLTTELLARPGRAVTAVDASPEMLNQTRQRLGDRVRLVQDDYFRYSPRGKFDAVVFTFVLSHVPRARMGEFWKRVGTWLAEGGSVHFADSMYSEASTAVDHELEGPTAESVLRRLNDGREFRIVKVFHSPEDLRQRLTSLGWRSQIDVAEDLLYFGSASPTGPT